MHHFLVQQRSQITEHADVIISVRQNKDFHLGCVLLFTVCALMRLQCGAVIKDDCHQF